VIWILLVILTVIGGAAAVGIAVNDKKKQLGSGGSPKQLPSGAHVEGDNLVERTVSDMRVGDVITIDGRDFICEGLINYDEDGHHWSCGRVVDASDVQWLMVGIERSGGAMRLLKQDESAPISGYPPEAIVSGELRYALDKRGAATCQLHGDIGGLSELKKDRPDGHVERCRWWLYSAPGDDTLLVEQWGGDYRMLKGKKVGGGTIELMPGS
jgi:Domain of unknown function (DUF4178)